MSVRWEEFSVKPGATFAYVQLANWIAARIEAGDLEAGERLPSQRDLGSLTGTSAELAGKAYALLTERGVIETSIKGSWVR